MIYRMNQNDFEIKIKELKSIKLGDKEKSQMKDELLLFMKNNPVRHQDIPRLQYQKSFRTSWSNLTPQFKFFFKTMTTAIVAIILAVTTSFAADSSLPGDLFYSVKLNVNEKARTMLAFSEEAKANLEIKNAILRLKEAEKLAVKNELNAETGAQIESNFKAQAKKVEQRIIEFKTKENFKAAADVSANFETALSAHEKILVQITAGSSEVKAVINPVVIQVKENLNMAAQAKVQTEESFSQRVNAEAGAKVEAQAAAEGKLKAAQNKIEEVEKFIENSKTRLSAEAFIEAEAKVKTAESAIVEGKARMEAEAFAEAFILFQKALQTAQEAKILVETDLELEINVGAEIILNPTPTPGAYIPLPWPFR